MLGRTRILAAGLMAGLSGLVLGNGNGAAPVSSGALKARRAIALDPAMEYGTGRGNKRSKNTTAQVKRASLKARNRARNKAAHRR